jgi:G3E family GTPase
MRTLYVTGGFLGSGKTTAICQAAGLLSHKKYNVAVITNDQGVRLVDGALVSALGLASTEIRGGCFCCRYPELETALRSLDHDGGPSIVLAEAAGSCTDMVATVIRPLEERYPSLRVVLTVLLDARLVAGLAAGKMPFDDPELNYIFLKQPEEADYLVVNKADQLSGSERASVEAWMRARFEGKPFRAQQSLEPHDVAQWLSALEALKPSGTRRSLEVDYDRYGAGEARLGWLDEELEIFSPEGRAVVAATRLVNAIYSGIRRRHYAIGHLKFLLTAADWHRKISFTSVTDPLLRETEGTPRIDRLTVIVNVRVRCSPAELSHVVALARRQAAASEDIHIETLGSEAFTPGYPTPTHRIT